MSGFTLVISPHLFSPLMFARSIHNTRNPARTLHTQHLINCTARCFATPPASHICSSTLATCSCTDTSLLNACPPKPYQCKPLINVNSTAQRHVQHCSHLAIHCFINARGPTQCPINVYATPMPCRCTCMKIFLTHTTRPGTHGTAGGDAGGGVGNPQE